MLLLAEQFRVAAFREGEVVHRTRLFCRLHLSRIRKHFQGVFPDRLEHQQTWLISSSVALLQQAFVKQGCNQVYSGKRVIRRCDVLDKSALYDRFGRLKCTASHKDGQAPKTALLLGIEEIITPANGVTQGVLPGGSILPSTRQHGKPVVETPQQGLGRQQFAPRRCQLQGQGQPVQLDTDLGYSSRVVLRKDQVGLHHLRALHEQGDRRVVQQFLMSWQVKRIRQGERRHGELVFALHVQYSPAGHQDLDRWTGQQQFHQRGRGFEDLLEVIQQQQEVFVP